MDKAMKRGAICKIRVEFVEHNEIKEAEKPVFTITKGDIQLEAQRHFRI
ncbi:MAG: hypothetical protein LBB61_08455 [Treponema sp.]|nr:hypothetical protein [Treponema sp.]